jgi:mRNA-degrading endonuclease RelE of RelBE toxin-antitoxin system
MDVVRTEDFERQFSRLPTRIRRLFDKQAERIRVYGIGDARLHTKYLHGSANVFSIRVTRAYRALFYRSVDDRIIFFDIDHRKDIYR